MAKRLISPLRVNSLHFRKFICAKNIQVQLEIDTIGEWCVPVVYIGGISTALCVRGFDAQVFLVKNTAMGYRPKLL